MNRFLGARRRWKPSYIPGLKLWLAADRITGLSDGQAVTTWPDLSGQGNNAVQGVDATAPIYKVGIANGRPVVRFNGTTDRMDLTSEPPLTTEGAIIVVAKQTVAASGRLYHHGYVSGANYPFWNVWYHSNRKFMVRRTDDAGTDVWAAEGYEGIGNTVTTLGTFNVVAAIHSFGTIKLLSANGAEESFTWVPNGSNKFITGLAGAFWRAHMGASLNGDIAEIIIFNQVPNRGALYRLLMCLKREYAINAPVVPFLTIPVQGWIGWGTTATVTAGAAGDHNAFPGMCRNTAGDLVIVYRSAGGHNSQVPYGTLIQRVSTDDGVTWGAEVTIASEAGIDYRDPTITKLASGRLIVNFFKTDWVNPPTGSKNVYVMVSDDGGATWGTPYAIGFSGVAGGTSGPVVQLPSGRLLAGRYRGSISCDVMLSDDDGDTWSGEVVVADAVADDRLYTEPNLVPLDDGRILCMLRVDGGNYYKAYSSDAGLTWSAPTLAFNTDGSENAPRTIQLADGRLLCTTRSATYGTAYLLSTDAGATWSAFAQAPSPNGNQNQTVLEHSSHLDMIQGAQSSDTNSGIYFTQGLLA